MKRLFTKDGGETNGYVAGKQPGKLERDKEGIRKRETQRRAAAHGPTRGTSAVYWLSSGMFLTDGGG